MTPTCDPLPNYMQMFPDELLKAPAGPEGAGSLQHRTPPPQVLAVRSPASPAGSGFCSAAWRRHEAFSVCCGWMMEQAWLRGLCGLCTACCVPYEEKCVVVLVMTVIAVAVCNQIAKSTDRSLRGHSLGAVGSVALLELWDGSSLPTLTFCVL